MKTLKAIIFASAALLAAVACTKEANPKEESVPSAPGTIEVSVTALIGDLAPSEGTKATMDPVIRLTWANGDKVYAYDATQNIGELTVTSVEGGSSAKLSGDISTPATGTTIITLVYCNTAASAPTIDGSTGKITFDLGTQDAAANPFVVYATLGYEDGLTSITDKIVPFTFATSLMRVTVTGLANTDITNATISGVNTKCELTVNADSEPDIAGTTPGTITRVADGITKSTDGRAIFNVSVAAEAENTNRTLTINQGILKYGSKLMSGAIAAGTSIISVYALTEWTGSRGKINGHDYVYVAGKKWATQNIAITDSGKKEWKPGGSTVTVPGNSSENVVVGDYFQWGAYQNYVTVNGDDKGLLIYSSFEITKYDGSNNSFSFKTSSGSNKYFFNTTTSGTSVGISPYYKSTAYERYTKTSSSEGDGRNSLDLSDDVAHTLWGESWRMPTGGASGEFQELFSATYWAWNDDDKGYYVYEPQEGDAGKKNTEKADDHTYNKADALLFFPAAGYGFDGNLFNAGTYGGYWSSTLVSDNTDGAYYLFFYSGNVAPQYGNYYRCLGFSVRPLSD